TYKLRGGRFANNRDKWRAYRESLTEFQPEILHAQEALAYGPMLAHLPRFPRVLMPWGPDIESLADPKTPREARRLIERACRAADVITANGPGLEEAWTRLTGLPWDRFQMFSWGTNTRRFSPRSVEEQGATCRRLGLDKK